MSQDTGWELAEANKCIAALRAELAEESAKAARWLGHAKRLFAINRDRRRELTEKTAEVERLKEQITPVQCMARKSASDPPQDCDWPWCPCDPHAAKVIEAIDEAGPSGGDMTVFVSLRQQLAAEQAARKEAERERETDLGT